MAAMNQWVPRLDQSEYVSPWIRCCMAHYERMQCCYGAEAGVEAEADAGG